MCHMISWGIYFNGLCSILSHVSYSLDTSQIAERSIGWISYRLYDKLSFFLLLETTSPSCIAKWAHAALLRWIIA